MDKVSLIHSETPLYKLNFHVDNVSIYMKRDDLLDFAFGGNKVRLFEYIAAEIEKQKPNRVVTYGSVYSNFLRVTAAVCSKMDISCDLIVLDEKNCSNMSGGNETLIKYYGANIIHCPLTNAYDFIDAYQLKLQSSGVNYFWIPGGGHLTIAGFGYSDVTYCILDDYKRVSGGVIWMLFFYHVVQERPKLDLFMV